MFPHVHLARAIKTKKIIHFRGFFTVYTSLLLFLVYNVIIVDGGWFHVNC